jgi:hypothetical protein
MNTPSPDKNSLTCRGAACPHASAFWEAMMGLYLVNGGGGEVGGRMGISMGRKTKVREDQNDS